MKLRRNFFYIVCQVSPDYKKHVRYENGKKVYYPLVLGDVYCCIEYALLWYNLFSTTLEVICFEINPYYICVSKTMV